MYPRAEDKKLSHVNRGASSTKPVDGAGGAAGLDTMAEVRRRAMDPWGFPDRTSLGPYEFTRKKWEKTWKHRVFLGNMEINSWVLVGKIGIKLGKNIGFN